MEVGATTEGRGRFDADAETVMNGCPRGTSGRRSVSQSVGQSVESTDFLTDLDKRGWSGLERLT